MGGEPSNEMKERVPPTFDGPIYPPTRAPAVSARQTAEKPPADKPAGVAPAQVETQTRVQPQASAPPPGQRPVFVSESAATPDALGRAAPLSRLSELIAHRGAQGPLSIALFGGPGSGKTHALADVVEGAGLLATAALSAPNGPFLPRLVVMRLEASDLGAEPEAAVAERLHARISREYSHVAQIAAEEAAHASADPRQTARALADSLDQARRRLSAERAALEDATHRSARLTETVLYESAGSQIDSYARASRGRIEPALKGFGFTGADPVADYKGLVHTLAESGGGGGRMLASLRSLWAYKGQKNLIVVGLLFFAIAWGLGALAVDRSWLSALESGGDTLKSVAAWFAGRLSLFDLGRRIADGLGLFCFVALLWRAWRFSRPLWRGANLLDQDVAARKGDIERQIAHHAQRVETLSREFDALAQRAADADRRAGGPDRPTASVSPAFLSEGPSRATQARAYLAALDAVISGGVKTPGAAPSRFVIAIDSLDRLPPERALATLSAIASVLALPSFALITAFDPRHFDSVPGAAAAIGRIIQTPFTLASADAPGWTAFVEQLAGRAAPPAPRATRSPQSGSTLDLPLAEPETKLLAALAELAGPSPRGVNRLVNLYRIARHDAPDDLAALACQMALAIGGTDPEKQAVAAALASADPSAPFAAPDAGPRVAAGLAAAAIAQGGPVTGASARRASVVARVWSF